MGATREAAFAGPDTWVLLGLLVTDDAARCIGVAAAVDEPAAPAQLALRRVTEALHQPTAPVEPHRWQRGGRPQRSTT